MQEFSELVKVENEQTYREKDIRKMIRGMEIVYVDGGVVVVMMVERGNYKSQYREKGRVHEREQKKE